MLIGYARVSTRDQDTRVQIDALRAAGCDEIYEEKRTGASLKKRPVLTGILATIQPNDTLIVYKLDRIARSLRDLLSIIEHLTHSKADFKSITETIDTSSPAGRMVLHVFGAFAEFEREIIRERTTAGMHAAIRRGAKVGRPRAFTAQEATEITALWRTGQYSRAELARRYQVHTRTIERAVLRAEQQLLLPLN